MSDLLERCRRLSARSCELSSRSYHLVEDSTNQIAALKALILEVGEVPRVPAAAPVSGDV